MNIKQQVIKQGVENYFHAAKCPCGHAAQESGDYCRDHKECFECEGEGCRLCDGEGWI